MAMGAVGTAAVIYGMRCLDALRHPRLWAEDGNVFFAGAAEKGFHAVWLPYNGYLHFVPRIIAWIGSSLDASVIPAFYVLSSYVVFLMSVAGVALAPVRMNCETRALMAVALAMVPHAGEVFVNPTNLHWILAAPQLLMLLGEPPTSRTGWWLRGTLTGLISLSSPITVFLLPVALVGQRPWCPDERRRRLAALAPACMGSVIQVIILVTTRTGAVQLTSYGLRDWADALTVGFWSPLVFGFEPPLSVNFRMLVCMAVAGVVTGASLWRLRRGDYWPVLFSGGGWIDPCGWTPCLEGTSDLVSCI